MLGEVVVEEEEDDGDDGSLGHSLGSVGVGTGGSFRGGSGSAEVTVGLGGGVVVGAVEMGAGEVDDADGRGTGVAEDGRPGREGRDE